MTSSALSHPKKKMAEPSAILRIYAKQVLVRGESLSFSEEQDKSLRMSLFFRIGADYKCTEKEMVGLVYEGSLR